MTDAREARLPQWAQVEMSRLREQARTATEPLIRELAAIRPELVRLKAINGAYEDLLSCAARGGHATATTIMEIISGYDLTLSRD